MKSALLRFSALAALVIAATVVFAGGPARADSTTTTVCPSPTTAPSATTGLAPTTSSPPATTSTGGTGGVAAGAGSLRGGDPAGSGGGGSGHPGGLVFTGADSLSGVIAGGFLIGAGLILVLASTRLRRRARPAGSGQTMACLTAGLVIAHIALASDQVGCGPPPALPETPLSVLLPLAAAAVFASAWLLARRRSGPRWKGSAQPGSN